MSIAGIKFETDMHGQRRYVRIDLKRFGKNQLLEDFLDGMEAERLGYSAVFAICYSARTALAEQTSP